MAKPKKIIIGKKGQKWVLLFMGCDASVLLDDNSGNKSSSSEKQAPPNQTLKAFEVIDMIKEELATACPGVVSCADTLALATRDGIALSGGPFYPVFTGRRDSSRSYFQDAVAKIPKPNDNITRALELFSSRGFNAREIVTLLGGHNVGKISYAFFQDCLTTFAGTGKPDPYMDQDFLTQMRLRCRVSNTNITTQDEEASTPFASNREGNEMMLLQGLSPSIPSGGQFDAHYYKNLLERRGVLFVDQQLTADENTKRVVSIYASDHGTTFRRDFARVIVRLSNLGVLTENEGQVRRQFSEPVSQS